MAAHGPVQIAARSRGVARRHAADGRRRLGRVGGEKLLGRVFQRFKRGQRLLVPARGLEPARRNHFSEVEQHDARLYGDKKAAILFAKRQDPVHAAQVEHVPSVRHGGSGQTGARALHGHRRARRVQRAQNVGDVGLAAGKGNGVSCAGSARFIAQIVGKLRRHRVDEGRRCTHEIAS